MNQVPLALMLGYWAEQRPADAIALVHESAKISWRELDARSNRLARAYARLGVKANDFVTIALPNGIEFFAANFAVWKLGATPQPVSAHLPKAERERIIQLADPSLVVGVAGEDHPSLATVPPGFEPEGSSEEPLELVVARSLKAMTSGGSTGRPKLIVSTTPAVWDVDSEYLRFRTGGSVLIPGPLYHNGPFLWGMIGLFKGNQVTVTTRFSAEETLAIIERQQVDLIYTVPTMMHRIWSLPAASRQAYDLSSLATLWHLAAPCPPWLKQAYIEWLGPDVIWELYGGTEGLGSTMISGREWLQHRGSVGKPQPSCQMKIMDEARRELPPNQIGEIFILPNAGPGSTYRYVGAEARTADGGWESLGDMGYMDADGYLYLTDRQADMILSGGANIYPAEVEAAIESCPGVRSCVVIGLPDEDLGNRIHAIVDVPGGEVSEQSLLDHLAEHLVRYKLPRSIEFTDKPVRDEAGKVQRSALRQARLAKA